MTIEKIYRILSAVLMPITLMLAFCTLPFVMMVFANPSGLFGLFVLICLLIYTFKSITFFKKSIIANVPSKTKTKDWIKVNGIVSLVLVVEIFVTTYMVFAKPADVLKALNVMMASMADKSGTQSISAESMYHALKNVMIFFSIYGALLTAHIGLTFMLLKKYKQLFAL